MTKYFVDAEGNYKGGYDGAEPPKDYIQIDAPPNYGRDKWNGLEWIPFADTQPNMAGFILAVNSDPMVVSNPELLFALASLMPVIQSDLAFLASLGVNFLPGHWQNALLAFGQTWLSDEVQAMLLGHAATYRIPIA